MPAGNLAFHVRKKGEPLKPRVRGFSAAGLNPLGKKLFYEFAELAALLLV